MSKRYTGWPVFTPLDQKGRCLEQTIQYIVFPLYALIKTRQYFFYPCFLLDMVLKRNIAFENKLYVFEGVSQLITSLCF